MLAYEASLSSGEKPVTFTPEIFTDRLDVIVASELIDREIIERRALEYIEDFNPNTKILRPLEAEDNARTAIFEALTASGHMSRVELPGRADEVHQQVMCRLLNGYYRPNIPEHERARVFQEICEELTIYETYLRVVIGDLPPETKVVTVSDFASPLGAEANKLGYRAANQKGMIRETSFEYTASGSPTRVIKQISRSNSDAQQTISALESAQVRVARKGYADVDLLGTQLLGAEITAIDIMKRLDRHAGMAVMYGEYKRADSVGYDDLETVSRLREQRVETFIDDLAAVERSLDRQLTRGDISQTMWNKQYGEKLRDIIRAICILEPGYVRDALGEKVVDAYTKAHDAFVSGDSAGASGIVSGVSDLESSIVVCGMEVGGQQSSESTENVTSDVQKMLEKSKWKWVDGYCRESLCPNSSKKTKVGPCNVCVNCQHIYDSGKQPSDIYKQQQQTSALADALRASQPSSSESSKYVAQLEKVETRIQFGGAMEIYRDKVTGMTGTKKELVGVS